MNQKAHVCLSGENPPCYDYANLLDRESNRDRY